MKRNLLAYRIRNKHTKLDVIGLKVVYEKRFWNFLKPILFLPIKLQISVLLRSVITIFIKFVSETKLRVPYNMILAAPL